MNLKLIAGLTAIILAIGFASNVLFVNEVFAKGSAEREAMKKIQQQIDGEKKKNKDAKEKSSVTKQISTLQVKLATLQKKLAKDPGNSALLSKIADVNSKIAKLQAKASKL